MTQRAKQLHATADGQIAELIELIATMDQAMLRLPCPGREKLGDGTVAGCVRHTADNYERIAGFVQSSDRRSGTLTRRAHDDQYTADNLDLDALMNGLSASRDALHVVAELSDLQLDSIPPKDSFRFCDGQRTLQQVLAGLLKHQSHQLDALRAVTV